MHEGRSVERLGRRCWIGRFDLEQHFRQAGRLHTLLFLVLRRTQIYTDQGCELHAGLVCQDDCGPILRKQSIIC